MKKIQAGSYLDFVLTLLVLSLIVDALAVVLNIEGRWPRVVAVALGVAWLAMVALATVGAWRLRQAQTPVRIGMFSLTVCAWALAVFHAGPQLGRWGRLAWGDDPRGVVKIQVAANARSVHLQGFIGPGAAAQLAQALKGSPQAYLLELDSSGGSIYESQRMAENVRTRGLQTRIVGACDNACVLVFMAGHGRQLMPGAQLGLQRLTSGTWNPMFEWAARRWVGVAYRGAGLNAHVVETALLASPAMIWHLDEEDMRAAAILSTPNQPLDVPLPPREGLLGAECLASLNANAAWRRLDAGLPGLIAQAAQKLCDAHAAGASGEDVQIAAQYAVELQLQRLLRQAGSALQAQYLDLLEAQLSAVEGAACPALLTGRVAARRALPAALVLRESTWLQSAAAEPKPRLGPKPASRIELEVLRRALGTDRAHTLLMSLRQAGGLPDCERALRLIHAVQQLSPAERRLATRIALEAP